jgi:hypothetical protein
MDKNLLINGGLKSFLIIVLTIVMLFSLFDGDMGVEFGCSFRENSYLPSNFFSILDLS